ncbi:MAG: VOC family protein [Candidatus Thiodiazotropha sp.]
MAILSVTPQLRTTNIENSIDFYVSKLGFELAFRYEDFYAGINVGGQQIHFKLVDEADPSLAFVHQGEHFHLYFTTDDVEKKAQALGQLGIPFHSAITETAWGTKEFAVADDQGHILYFGQPLQGR